MKKQKLELTWIGKELRPKLEPRILLEDKTKSYHANRRFGENDHFDNRLIFGDNLLALKALEHEFTGKVKCIYIDPPYNTGSAFAEYEDGLEHSIWLALIRERLILLRRLLDEGVVVGFSSMTMKLTTVVSWRRGVRTGQFHCERGLEQVLCSKK